MVDLPSGRKIRTRKDCNLGDDEELGNIFKSIGKIGKGILKVAAPVAGGIFGGPVGAMVGSQVGKLGGKALSKLGKAAKKKALVEAGLPPDLADNLAEQHEQGQSQPVITPEQVQQHVVSALREYNNSKLADQQSAKQIASTVSPKLNNILKLAKKRQLQQQVTQEHNRIVKSDNRWKSLDEKHKVVLARLDALDKKLDVHNLRNRIVSASFGIPTKFL